MLARNPAPRSRTMATIDAAVAKLGPFPDPVPLPPISPFKDGKGWYTDMAAQKQWEAFQAMGPFAPPCRNPVERQGGLQYMPTCKCGHLLGSHKTGGAK